MKENAKFILKVGAKILKEHDTSLKLQASLKTFSEMFQKEEKPLTTTEELYNGLTNKEEIALLEKQIEDYKMNFDVMSVEERKEKIENLSENIRFRRKGMECLISTHDVWLKKNTIRNIIVKQKREDWFAYFNKLETDLINYKAC